MDAVEAEATFRAARRQLEGGQITLHEYNAIVARLLYQDNTGTWWAISPADGSWLKWNGSSWLLAFPESVPVSPPGSSQQVPLEKAGREEERPALQAPAQSPSYIPPISRREQPARAEPAGEAGSHHGPPAAEPADLPLSPFHPVDGLQEPGASPSATTADLPLAADRAGFARHRAGIAALLLAIASWLVYPYIVGTLALLAGGYALWSEKKATGTLPLPAGAAVMVALAAMLLTSLPSGT
jgi:hypothetical protein